MTNDKFIGKNSNRKHKKNPFFTRLIVSITGLTVCLLVLFLAPLWGKTLLISIVSGLIAYELSWGTKLIKNSVLCIFTTGLAFSFPFFTYLDLPNQLIPIYSWLLLFVGIFMIMFSDKKISVSEVLTSQFAGVVIPSIISLLVSLLKMENSIFLFLIPFIVAWCCDTGAYIIGSLKGKHKFFPSISPNKSLEGVVGGILTSILGMAIYCLILFLLKKDFNILPLIIISILCPFISILGDLFFSYIKRQCNIKDYSKILPGHGGILDRFDSVIFTLPVCYSIFLIFEVFK